MGGDIVLKRIVIPVLSIILIIINISVCEKEGKIEEGIIDYLISKHEIEQEFDGGYMVRPPKEGYEGLEKADLNKADADELIKYFNSLELTKPENIEINDDIPIRRIRINSNIGYDDFSIHIFNNNQFEITVSTLEREYDEKKDVYKMRDERTYYRYRIVDGDIDFELLNYIFKSSNTTNSVDKSEITELSLQSTY